jgi:hypothetical protein
MTPPSAQDADTSSGDGGGEAENAGYFFFRR